MLSNAVKTLGYVKVGQFYVKLIGYGAVVIDPDVLEITSLFKSGTTGELLIWANANLEDERALEQIVEFETYKVKSTVYFHGPLTELLT